MLTKVNGITKIGVSIGLLALVQGAGATILTQTFTIPSTTPPTTNGFPYALFDTNTGTLASVTIELVSNGTADLTAFNDSASPVGWTNGFTSIPLTVTGPPPGGVGTTQYLTTTLSASFPSGIANPGANTYPGVATNNDTGAIAINPALWAGNFEAPGGGFGPADLVVGSGDSSSGGTGGGNVFFGGSANYSGTLTLVYVYNGIVIPGQPEPGTWALVLATGSVAFAGLRRRRALRK